MACGIGVRIVLWQSVIGVGGVWCVYDESPLTTKFKDRQRGQCAPMRDGYWEPRLIATSELDAGGRVSNRVSTTDRCRPRRESIESLPADCDRFLTEEARSDVCVSCSSCEYWEWKKNVFVRQTSDSGPIAARSPKSALVKKIVG